MVNKMDFKLTIVQQYNYNVNDKIVITKAFVLSIKGVYYEN